MIFENREEGGRRLAAALEHLMGRADIVVVGLPRGGVPVAAQVAEALDAPLDVIVVRKLGVPYQPELAMGAIGEDGARVVDDEIVRLAHVSAEELSAVEAREQAELTRRAERFRRGRSRLPLGGRHVIVVDDGIATGSTMRAACAVARIEGAERITIAVPVAPADWTRRLAGLADEYVAVATPLDFMAVGRFYRDFRQTSDDEVVEILDAAAARMSPSAVPSSDERPDGGRPVVDEDVEIRVDGTILAGHLTVPPDAHGLVVFAHGSGSSRHSPRNRFVARVLERAGLATLLFDLLTHDEEVSRANVFDIGLLAHRLVAVTEWAHRRSRSGELPIGFFGASTGAAAALVAAADPTSEARAVVSRGGRPDLAGSALSLVRAPTLLVVGARDSVVLDLNHRARTRLTCPSELSIVPGASHLFEEPGTLQTAAELARDWFVRYLTPLDPPTRSASSAAADQDVSGSGVSRRA
ncbi:MAG TPA: phosphoribosyltransferase family protein [Ilumatobacter sp.]|nr:phosphoribosyltransferase family protein [Ilumatobacter sp.]